MRNHSIKAVFKGIYVYSQVRVLSYSLNKLSNHRFFYLDLGFAINIAQFLSSVLATDRNHVREQIY